MPANAATAFDEPPHLDLDELAIDFDWPDPEASGEPDPDAITTKVAITTRALMIAESSMPHMSVGHLADCERTNVLVELVGHDGTRLNRSFGIAHVGMDVQRVEFPEDFRVLLRTLGLDPYSSAAEGWLEIQATMAFWRKVGR